MIYILLSVIAVMGFAIIRISISYRNARRMHERNVDELKKLLRKLNDAVDQQSGQLQLSEELREKLRTARGKIDVEILELQYTLVELLSKNNLIR